MNGSKNLKLNYIIRIMHHIYVLLFITQTQVSLYFIDKEETIGPCAK